MYAEYANGYRQWIAQLLGPIPNERGVTVGWHVTVWRLRPEKVAS